VFYILSLTWRLLNLSVECNKTIYVFLWTSAKFSSFYFLLTFYRTWNTTRISHFWILIACEEVREFCYLINSPPHDVNCPPWPSLLF
jgi:hypothetical protein